MSIGEPTELVDQYGRTWQLKADGGYSPIYVHDGMAVPGSFVTDGKMGLPTDAVLSNPNYPPLCDICLNGRKQEQS